MSDTVFSSANFQPQNRAFLYGDAVKVSFFVRNSQLIIAEESYFFLMASMRKMRMNIPLTFTLDFFEELFQENVINKGVSDGIIQVLLFRNSGAELLEKAEVSFYVEVDPKNDVLAIQGDY